MPRTAVRKRAYVGEHGRIRYRDRITKRVENRVGTYDRQRTSGLRDARLILVGKPNGVRGTLQRIKPGEGHADRIVRRDGRRHVGRRRIREPRRTPRQIRRCELQKDAVSGIPHWLCCNRLIGLTGGKRQYPGYYWKNESTDPVHRSVPLMSSGSVAGVRSAPPLGVYLKPRLSAKLCTVDLPSGGNGKSSGKMIFGLLLSAGSSAARS